MRARTLVAAFAVLLPHLAFADGHKVLVLQSEGRADAGLRARINTAIIRLAAAADLQASAGQVTFSDAATAVGCKPDAPGCKDEVLAMLSVDEIVVTTVTPRPGGVEITVRRIGKGGASREATMVLAAGSSADKLDGIAPLFSDRAAAPAGSAPGAPALSSGPPTGTEPPAGPAVLPGPGDAPVDHAAASPADRPGTEAGTKASTDASTEANTEASTQPSATHHRLELAGMAGGATLVAAGLLCWAAASGTQGDIDSAPTRTAQDLSHLRDLESRGDTYATVGNVLFIGGVVVAGVATYFYVRDRRAASSTSARLVPTVFDHGVGVALTFGGVR
jgi:hypothetical protein